MPHLPGTEPPHSVTAALALQRGALCLSSIIVLAHTIVSAMGVGGLILTALTVATRHFSGLPFARRRRFRCCSDSVCDTLTGRRIQVVAPKGRSRCSHPHGPKIPAPGIRAVPAQAVEPARPCHPHACYACPQLRCKSAGCVRTAAPATPGERPLSSVNCADAAAAAVRPHACSDCACLPVVPDKPRVCKIVVGRAHCIETAAVQVTLPRQLSPTHWQSSQSLPPRRQVSDSALWCFKVQIYYSNLPAPPKVGS